MVTRLPARVPCIGYCTPCSGVNPSRNTLTRAVASLVLSCQLGVLYSSEQRPEKATFLAKAPLFKAAIKLWSLLDCQAENVASSSRTLGDQRVKRGSAAFIRPT